MRKKLLSSLVLLLTCVSYTPTSPLTTQAQDAHTYLGMYPQTLLTDNIIYDDLYFYSLENEPDLLNWYYYYGNYYAIVQTSNIKDGMTFNNGQQVLNNRTYFFKVEKIKWELNRTDGNYYLTSSSILDVSSYNESEYEINTSFSSSTIYEHLLNYSAIALNQTGISALKDFYVNRNSVYRDSEDESLTTINISSLPSSHLKNDEVLKECSDYAIARGLECKMLDGKRIGEYWLENVGTNNEYMTYVNYDGQTIYNKKVMERLGIVLSICLEV